MIKIFPGPFTSPRTAVMNHLPQRSVINAKDSPLKERIAALARAKEKLTSCNNVNELMIKIDALAKKLLDPVGQLIYLAFIGPRGELTALTYQEETAPLPFGLASKRSLFASRNQAPTFPIKPDLILAAIDTKDIHREESERKEYLALPLVSPDRSRVLGILLLVNHFNSDAQKINSNDLEVAKAFAEVSSEELFKLLPKYVPAPFA